MTTGLNVTAEENVQLRKRIAALENDAKGESLWSIREEIRIACLTLSILGSNNKSAPIEDRDLHVQAEQKERLHKLLAKEKELIEKEVVAKVEK